MPAFALPQAVSPRVAVTLSRFAHYPVLDRVCQRALQSGAFKEVKVAGSLHVLQRTGDGIG